MPGGTSVSGRLSSQQTSPHHAGACHRPKDAKQIMTLLNINCDQQILVGDMLKHKLASQLVVSRSAVLVQILQAHTSKFHVVPSYRN